MKQTNITLIVIYLLLFIVLLSPELNAQITSWSSTTSLPENRQYAGAVVWNERIYVTGGDADATFTGTNTVYRATINLDGSISSWTSSTMPVYKAAHGTVVWNSRLYVLGGYNDWGSDTRSVRYAPIIADGSLGSWSVATDMPEARIGLSAAVWNGRIYATGGASGVVITARNSLYIGTLSGDGSIASWVSTTLPVARAFHATLAINGRLYIIGGGTGDWADTNATNTVFFATIAGDGSIGTWSSTTSLPSARNRHVAFFDPAFSQIYIVGGKDADQNTRSEVWYARVESDGTFGNWTTTTSLSAARKDMAVAVNTSDNRAYIMGGTNPSDAVLNTTVYTTDPPLPIQLAYFSATPIHWNDVLLEWSTISEINNYGFEVERRSIAGTGEKAIAGEWAKVGFVKGAGTSKSPKEYTFVDAKLKPGRHAYRIKQIDNDGTFTYAASAEVMIGEAARVFTLDPNYPNPFNSSTKIQFTVPNDGHASLRVYNMLAQEVAVLFNGRAEAGKIHQTTFDASQLPTGMYFYRLEFGNQQTVKKMLFVK